jgi:hypothetical protein
LHLTLWDCQGNLLRNRSRIFLCKIPDEAGENFKTFKCENGLCLEPAGQAERLSNQQSEDLGVLFPLSLCGIDKAGEKGKAT